MTLDAALDAGIPTVDPTELSVALEFGADPVIEVVDLGNIGLRAASTGRPGRRAAGAPRPRSRAASPAAAPAPPS